MLKLQSIDGVCEHIDVKDMSSVLVRKLKDVLRSLNLDVYAFAGYVDLTDDLGNKRFLTKMEFAKEMGAHIINANAGPLNEIDGFYKNIGKIE